MALSGLDIYKLLPKTNCKQCGFATCLAFAMQLARKALTVEKCPFISEEAKRILEEQSLPAIRLITLGAEGEKLEIGNETVMFRHEEKFRNPAGLGFIIEDSLEDAEIKKRLEKINKLKFERVGQILEVNLIAVKQCLDPERFLRAVEVVLANSALPLMLISGDSAALKKTALRAMARRPLLCCANKENFKDMASVAGELGLPLVAAAQDALDLAYLTKELNSLGIKDLILDTGIKSVTEKIWDLTQIRRQALKRSNRALGYPSLVIVDKDDPYEEAIEASAYIAKYAGIVLIRGIASWEVLSILTLRQNIFTDPQKPLQVEPRLYPVGKATKKSPVLVTTNFSLTYYTVLGEVEASKIPSYILSVDTEGMSVLTAWAAEKFNADSISKALDKCGIKDAVEHRNLIIPGYVAVLSGDLEEKSGFKVIVGPKEAAGLPAFLKNLN
ncbi:MAG: acetyl-CoA decarbonylase/synthase complex subunit gamma [Candidatus Omnitrophica bacterium]|nr:acetyl-CoA decarbonylase/synthase complex subunit gamma [Candidatus Omnitrophota bacterium]MDD5771524.1 acetyl-CoA decarbonylase/synthase complex subunit gamma [Candidatus Omnitrophota bacterium]